MRKSKCRGCGAEILFIQTQAGKFMPVDNRKVVVVTESGKVVRGYTSHFATCPEADHFRSKGRSGD